MPNIGYGVRPETPTQKAERETKEIHEGRKPVQTVPLKGEQKPKPAPTHVYIVGASEFGGPNDASTRGDVGYHSNHLAGKMAFAELNMGTALGSLPFGTKCYIQTYNKNDPSHGAQIVAEKLDIGLGGAPVEGHARRVDLWYQTAQAIGFHGTGLVRISRVDGKPLIGPGDQETSRDEAKPVGLPNPADALVKLLSAILSVPTMARVLKVIIGTIILLIAIDQLTKIGPGPNTNLTGITRKAL